MKITINKKGILPCYLPYIRDYETRVSVFYGGAGSGKSYFVMQKIILKAPKGVGVCVRDAII